MDCNPDYKNETSHTETEQKNRVNIHISFSDTLQRSDMQKDQGQLQVNSVTQAHQIFRMQSIW